MGCRKATLGYNELKANVSDTEKNVKQEMGGFCMITILITLKLILNISSFKI